MTLRTRSKLVATAVALLVAGGTAVVAGVAVAAGAAGTAKGAVTYKARGAPVTVALKHAWLVKGPDAVDPKKIVRKLILSADDIGAKIAACRTMSCVDADLNSGMTVDFDAGPRLNYWIVLDNQRVQYSGTAAPAAFKAAADTATRLAGKLVIDDTKAGGPGIDVQFDTPLAAELKAAR